MRRPGRPIGTGGLVAAATFAAALMLLSAAPPPTAAQVPAAAGEAVQIDGSWRGARLLCQKEEGRLLRCGTPAPFEITFVADGSGTTSDTTLPQDFNWRRLEPGELGIKPAAGGEEVKLFGLERDEEMLTFQAYVFLPTSDPDLPPEARYIHYIFDVSLIP